MTILLDTHTFLWFIDDSPKLSQTAKTLIENSENDRILSIASLWEMAIKLSLNKLELDTDDDFETFISSQLRINDINILPIQLRHLQSLSQLPFYHRDPFDRIMIAQSQVEQIAFISADQQFDAYGIQQIW